MCRCLDVQRYNGNYLKVHTNYRCTNSLKQCNQSLSFKYSVIDSSDENEEEVYISTRINVPYNKVNYEFKSLQWVLEQGYRT